MIKKLYFTTNYNPQKEANMINKYVSLDYNTETKQLEISDKSQGKVYKLNLGTLLEVREEDKIDYSKLPFTFKAVNGDGDLILTSPSDTPSTYYSSYKKNNDKWIKCNQLSTKIHLEEGDTLSLSSYSILPQYTYLGTGFFNVYGNINSFNLKTQRYYSTFNKIKKYIIDASNLILPSTLIPRCYQAMFQNCTSLTAAPELPATTLAPSCYMNMFEGCTSLSTAPTLPALELVPYCYYNMFRNCSSLIKTPKIYTKSFFMMWENSYYDGINNMFAGCTSIKLIDLSLLTFIMFTIKNPNVSYISFEDFGFKNLSGVTLYKSRNLPIDLFLHKMILPPYNWKIINKD